MPALLTDRFLKALRPRATRYEVFEARKAFGVRVSPLGTVTFIYRYKYRGRPRVATLGRYGEAPPALTLGEAREKYNTARAAVERGGDPAAGIMAERRARREAPTVEELAAEFMARHVSQLRPATVREYGRLIDHEILPALGPLKAADVTRASVTALLDTVRDRIIAARRERARERGEEIEALAEPMLPNRVLALLSAMFAWAVEKDLARENPAAGRRRPTAERKRGRFLADAEIPRFWYGLDSPKISATIRRALRLLLLTGTRAGEVCGATWDELDLERGLWELPPARTKNGRRHVVPLAPAALAIIEEAREASKGGPFVFHGARVRKKKYPGVDTEAKRLELHILPAALAHAVRLNLPTLTRPGAAPLTPHALRHTVRTGLAALGTPRHVAEAVLNHAPPGISGLYDHHAYLNEKRAALDAWAAHVEGLLRKAAKA